MTKPKYEYKKDTEHDIVKEALERSGYSVYDMADVGDDFPDLLVVSKAAQPIPVLLEVKGEGEYPTKGQVSFLTNYPGPCSIVFSVEHALDVMSRHD